MTPTSHLLSFLRLPTLSCSLFDLIIKGLTWDKIRDIIVVVVFLLAVLAVLLLHALVALGQLA